jgi:hypothetical protein
VAPAWRHATQAHGVIQHFPSFTQAVNAAAGSFQVEDLRFIRFGATPLCLLY